MAELIKTEGLTKKFDQVVAVDSVDLVMDSSLINGVIGPNGSGKTTLFNLFSGLFPPTEGKIHFFGQDISTSTPQQRVHLGMGRTFQLVSVFSTLSVWENLVLSTCHRESDLNFKDFYFADNESGIIYERCLEALEKVGLADKSSILTSELSYGDKRLLEIGMALSLEPKVLFLDEPFSGLSDVEIDFVLKLLNDLKTSLPIVIIEHKISKIIDLVEHLYVLREGALIVEGNPREVIDDPLVHECYWGKGVIKC